MHNEIPREARPASRVIMIDSNKRVLYLRASEPKTCHVFWVMPGGGLEPGESFEDAAKREAYEESGCSFNIGPYVWYRRHKHVWNDRPFDQYERFFVATVFDPIYDAPMQDGYISDHKWWSLDEIRASNEEFAPRRIGDILSPILNGEYPEVPLDCGV